MLGFNLNRSRIVCVTVAISAVLNVIIIIDVYVYVVINVVCTVLCIIHLFFFQGVFYGNLHFIYNFQKTDVQGMDSREQWSHLAGGFLARPELIRYGNHGHYKQL